METRNAMIEEVRITSKDIGCLTIQMTLDLGTCNQGINGYILYSPNKEDRQESEVAGRFIWRLMAIAEVSEWSDLKGKMIRIRGDMYGIEAVGHILREDWCYLKEAL